MGVSALLASAELLWRLNPRLGRDPQGPCLLEVSRRHWNYGRWALAGAVFLWVPWNICYPLVTKFWGLAETGTLRALLNLALPITQAHSARPSSARPEAYRSRQDPKTWSPGDNRCSMEPKGTRHRPVPIGHNSSVVCSPRAGTGPAGLVPAWGSTAITIRHSPVERKLPWRQKRKTAKAASVCEGPRCCLVAGAYTASPRPGPGSD